MSANATKEQISKLTLLLIYLSSWEEKNADNIVKRAWTGYDFDVLNQLQEKHFILQSKGAKSLYLTKEGEKLAESLLSLLAKI